MHFGIFMEFESRQGRSQTESFREGFELVEAADTWGLDGVWLGEMHFNPARSVLGAPIVVASSIATRTQRLRVGMAVQVLPFKAGTLPRHGQSVTQALWQSKAVCTHR